MKLSWTCSVRDSCALSYLLEERWTLKNWSTALKNACAMEEKVCKPGLFSCGFCVSLLYLNHVAKWLHAAISWAAAASLSLNPLRTGPMYPFWKKREGAALPGNQGLKLGREGGAKSLPSFFSGSFGRWTFYSTWDASSRQFCLLHIIRSWVIVSHDSFLMGSDCCMTLPNPFDSCFKDYVNAEIGLIQ